jgi:hypothetical protein
MTMSTQSYPIFVESGALMDPPRAILENSAVTRPKLMWSALSLRALPS